MISEGEARRLDGWIGQAVASGATLLCGGNCEGAMLDATLLEGVDRSSNAYREEAFGPMAMLSKFSDFNAALYEVNDSKFGLQAGIFTRDLFKTLYAWDRLEAAGSPSTTCLAIGSKTCRTVASRIQGSAAKSSGLPWKI